MERERDYMRRQTGVPLAEDGTLNYSTSTGDERCGVCHVSAPEHGGLCCKHRYDEQPPCPRCPENVDRYTEEQRREASDRARRSLERRKES